MILTEEEMQEFKRLVLKKYGIELTDEQAMDQVSRLVQLFELLLKNKIDLGPELNLNLDDSEAILMALASPSARNSTY